MAGPGAPLQWVNGKQFDVTPVPLDAEGFAPAFAPDDAEGYTAFFRRHGFCVVRDVLNRAELDATILDLWDDVEQYRPRRDRPATWDGWPGLPHLGILGEVAGEQVWRNRLNPRLHQVFRTLLGSERLWVSVDNCGMMRPTRAVPKRGALPPAPGGVRWTVEDAPAAPDAVADMSGWRSKEQWLHWDMNPFAWFAGEGRDYSFDGSFITENNGARRDPGGIPKVQGLVCLVDAREQDGGFLTVPGFCHHLREWAGQPELAGFRDRQARNLDFVYVPKGEPMLAQTQRVPVRAGSLLVWNSEQPHANYPNDSARFRMVQYVKMFPAPPAGAAAPEALALRREGMLLRLPVAVAKTLTTEDQRVLGLADYPSPAPAEPAQQ